jgi:UDP-glucose 4-epimerase
VARLIEAQYSVRAATRWAGSFSNSVDVAIVPDFAFPVDWKPILEDVDIVIHLAGLAHVKHHYPRAETFNLVNVRATRDLARAAAEAKVEHFVLVSSVRAQVASSSPNIIHETDEPHPTNDYGLSKLAAERAARGAGVPLTVLRPVAIYGPNSKGNIKTLARVASTPWPLPLAGFTARRSLLCIENFISAVLFVISNPKTIGEAYLVSDSDTFTLVEVVAMMRKAQGRQSSLFYFPPNFIRLMLIATNQGQLWRRLGEHLVVDTTKLQAAGWRPPVDTYAGLTAMIRAEGQADVRDAR